MQELRLVAVSEDGTYLVLATAGRGTRFTLPVDDRLRAAVRGNFSRLGQYEIEVESPLRPKEIQARIRAGESAEEIAATAGIPVERVRWFEGPVLQEREYVAQQAQRVAVRLPGEATPRPTLGELVAERLMRRGVPNDEIDWDSCKRDDGLWRVKLGYVWNGHTRHAECLFDARRRHITPHDDEAHRLSAADYVEPAEDTTVTPFVPRLTAKLTPVPAMPPSFSPMRQEPAPPPRPEPAAMVRPEPFRPAPGFPPIPPARQEPARQEIPRQEPPRQAEPARQEASDQGYVEPAPVPEPAPSAPPEVVPQPAASAPRPTPEPTPALITDRPEPITANPADGSAVTEDATAADLSGGTSVDAMETAVASTPPAPTPPAPQPSSTGESAGAPKSTSPPADSTPVPEPEAAVTPPPAAAPAQPPVTVPAARTSKEKTPAQVAEPQVTTTKVTQAEAPTDEAIADDATAGQATSGPSASPAVSDSADAPHNGTARTGQSPPDASQMGEPATEDAKTEEPDAEEPPRPEASPQPPKPQPPKPARPRKGSRSRRASVPTWDEIMFGARRQD